MAEPVTTAAAAIALDEGGGQLLKVLLGLALVLVGLVVVIVVTAVASLSSVLALPWQGSTGPAPADIPPVYVPIYQAAAAHYHVNWYLLASIHKQESGFSTGRAPSLVGDAVSSGWNACGAAGPVQMGIVGVAPYFASTRGCSAGGTWSAYRRAADPIAKARPASYPQQRGKLAACQGVPRADGCVYDDFDALSGLAMKLHGDGATADLESQGTYHAVCAYIGSCSNVQNCGGPNSYCGVLPQAKAWEQAGLTLDPALQSPDASGVVFPTSPRAPVTEPFGIVDGLHASPHTGIDIGAHFGDRVLAFRTGRVVLVQTPVQSGGYGNYVCIEHVVATLGDFRSCYAHMQDGSVRVKVGQTVAAGQQIGSVGATGFTDGGAHLHFEIKPASGGFLCPALEPGLGGAEALGPAATNCVVDRLP